MKWDEVTWYSKLGALLLFIGVVPGLTFYIGMKYEETRNTYDMIPTEIVSPPDSETVITETLPLNPVENETPSEQRDVATPKPPLKACYKGGCSGQLCTDRPDMASTCEYREEYACYADATCERQPSGECGWTETASLSACLISAQTGNNDSDPQ